MFAKEDLIKLKDTTAIFKVNGVAEDGGLHVESLSHADGRRVAEEDREFLYLPESTLHHYQKVSIRAQKGGTFIVFSA